MGNVFNCCKFLRFNKKIMQEIQEHTIINNGGDTSMSFNQIFSEKIEIINLPTVFEQDETYKITNNDNISVALSNLQNEEDFDVESFVSQTESADDLDLLSLSHLGEKSIQALMSLYQVTEGMELFRDSSGVDVHYSAIQTTEKHWLSIVRYQYTIQTTLQRYYKWSIDLESQKQSDKQIDAYERVKGDENCCLIYLRYQKFLMMDPRDFLYVKYIDYAGDRLVEASKSINLSGFPRTQSREMISSQKTLRGVIKISGSVVETIDESSIMVSVYSQTDMRVKANPKITKPIIVSEIRKSIQRIRKVLE